MKKLLFTLWFISFMLTIMSVENLNALFVISFVVLGLTTYKIKQKGYGSV
jgi:hypothetical protein